MQKKSRSREANTCSGGWGSYDEENAYSGDDLGCMYTPEKTTFKVWSPEASSVVLCRFEAGNGGSAISETPMTKGDKGVWSAEVTGDILYIQGNGR